MLGPVCRGWSPGDFRLGVVPQSFKARPVRALSFLRAGQAPHFCPGQGPGPVAGCLSSVWWPELIPAHSVFEEDPHGFEPHRWASHQPAHSPQLSLALIEKQAPIFIRAHPFLEGASDLSFLSHIHSVPVSRLVAQCQCSCVLAFYSARAGGFQRPSPRLAAFHAAPCCYRSWSVRLLYRTRQRLILPNTCVNRKCSVLRTIFWRGVVPPNCGHKKARAMQA